MAVQAFTSNTAAPRAPVRGIDAADLPVAFVDPYENPDDEDTVWLADIPLPPPGTGRATLKLPPPKAKLPATASIGKSHPKIRKTGNDAAEGTITIEASHDAGPALHAAAQTLIPGSGPFPIRHRKARLSRVEHVMVESWDDAPNWTGDRWTWSVHVKSVKLAIQNGKGGAGAVKTPKAAYVDVRPGNVVIGSNGNQVGGFGVGIGSNDNRVSGMFPSNDPGGAKAKAEATKKEATKP